MPQQSRCQLLAAEYRAGRWHAIARFLEWYEENPDGKKPTLIFRAPGMSDFPYTLDDPVAFLSAFMNISTRPGSRIDGAMIELESLFVALVNDIGIPAARFMN